MSARDTMPEDGGSHVAATTPAERTFPVGRALLGRAAVVVWNDIADAGRKQFYDWHDREHVPERLAIPGFRRGRRYARAGHSPEWLTLYEADDLDALTSPSYLARLNAPTPLTTRTLVHFRNTSRAIAGVVCSLGASTGGHVLAMRLDVPLAGTGAMCAHVSEVAFPRAMAQGGVVACHLLAGDAAASQRKTTESAARTFDVPSWVVLVEATRADAAADALALLDDDALRATGATVAAGAAVYALEICRLAGPADDAAPRTTEH